MNHVYSILLGQSPVGLKVTEIDDLFHQTNSKYGLDSPIINRGCGDQLFTTLASFSKIIRGEYHYEFRDRIGQLTYQTHIDNNKGNYLLKQVYAKNDPNKKLDKAGLPTYLKQPLSENRVYLTLFFDLIDEKSDNSVLTLMYLESLFNFLYADGVFVISNNKVVSLNSFNKQKDKTLTSFRIDNGYSQKSFCLIIDVNSGANQAFFAMSLGRSIFSSGISKKAYFSKCFTITPETDYVKTKISLSKDFYEAITKSNEKLGKVNEGVYVKTDYAHVFSDKYDWMLNVLSLYHWYMAKNDTTGNIDTQYTHIPTNSYADLDYLPSISKPLGCLIHGSRFNFAKYFTDLRDIIQLRLKAIYLEDELSAAKKVISALNKEIELLKLDKPAETKPIELTPIKRRVAKKVLLN